MAKADEKVAEETPVVEVGSEFKQAVEGGEVVLKHEDDMTPAQLANLGKSELADDSLEDTVVLGFAEVAERVRKNKK